MNNDLRDKIIADIKATGFPTELLVAQTFKSLEWDIEQNGTYLDYELNKSREIDIQARKVFGRNNTEGGFNFYVAINLSVEIKKSTKRPWVVFSIPNNQEEYSTFLGPGFGQLTYSDNFNIDILSAKKLMKEFPRNEEVSIGTSFYEAFKSTEEPSKIYEAVMSSIKAAFYSRKLESSEEFLSEEELDEINSKDYDKDSMTRLEIYMPLIVFEGVLCVANLDDNNEIELTESNYIPLTISHTIKPYNEHFNYYPELIHFNYVEEFLTRIDKWGKSLKKTAKK